MTNNNTNFQKNYSDLSFEYIDRLNNISKSLNLTEVQTLQLLIDLYYIDSYESLGIVRERISKRIEKGVNKDFLISLKSLYVFLGHFLQKIRYLK